MAICISVHFGIRCGATHALKRSSFPSRRNNSSPLPARCVAETRFRMRAVLCRLSLARRPSTGGDCLCIVRWRDFDFANMGCSILDLRLPPDFVANGLNRLRVHTVRWVGRVLFLLCLSALCCCLVGHFQLSRITVLIAEEVGKKPINVSG